MDEINVENNGATLEVFKILKEQFPDKQLNPSSMKKVSFLDWKLVDLKRFLMITGDYKGLSKAKKEKVLETVSII